MNHIILLQDCLMGEYFCIKTLNYQGSLQELETAGKRQVS